MSNVTIPQIPGFAIGLDGSELMELVQGGVSKQVTTALIAALLLAITSVPRTAPLARQPAVQVGAWVLIAACVLINALH